MVPTGLGTAYPSMSLTPPNDRWYMDSDDTNHMTRI